MLEGVGSAQYKDVLGTEGLREAMVNTIMPLILLLYRREIQDTPYLQRRYYEASLDDR